MANPEHQQILSARVDAWNAWRDSHRDVTPDLRDADLSERAGNTTHHRERI